MLRRWLSDIDHSTGGALRRATGRAQPATVQVASLAGEWDRLAGVNDYTVLHPSRTVALDDDRLCAFLARQTAVANTGCTFQTEDVFVATLADATFDPHSGAVWAANGSLLVDSIKNAGRLKHVSAAPIAAEELPGLYSSIAGPIAGNTFHWLIESLPRLYSLTHISEPVTLLMPDTLSVPRREDVARCLPPNVTLRFVAAQTRLRIERFVLPSFLTTQWDFAYPPADHLAFVRDRLNAAYALLPEPVRRERIYISRAHARVRRATNEAAVLDLLRPLGFRPVYLEALPFSEQMQLFHDAEIVVAPHGAGLANLIFAGRIPVLEFASRAVNPVYFFLALALEQDYRYLYPAELLDGERPPKPAEGRRYSHARDQDITIDLEALRDAIQEWR